MIRDKALFLASLPVAPCPEGIKAFLSHEGDSLDYFLHHERGPKAISWCFENGADVAEALALTTSLPYLTLYAGATITAPVLAEVVGGLNMYEGSTLNAPVLAKVGGSLNMFDGLTLTAPLLAEVGGYLCLHTGATMTAPLLSEVGDLYLYDGYSLTAPLLKR